MTLAYYEIGTLAAAPAGTISATAGTKTISGSGTAFLTALAAGRLIVIHRAAADEYRVVNTVATDTSCAVYGANLAAIPAGTAFDVVTMTNVESLSAAMVRTPPRGIPFTQYSKSTTLASGMERGDGWSVTTWTWAVLTAAQRVALEAYVSADYGLSADLYMRTNVMAYSVASSWDPGMVWQYYSGIAVFPRVLNPDARKYLGYQIQWRRLERLVVPFTTS